MLWVGWFGFNGGSAAAAGAGAAFANLVTHLSASMAGLVWLLLDYQETGKTSAIGLCTGAVAGLAAITPALMIGAFVERMKFNASVVYMALWSVAVYYPACHLIWGGGALAAWGVIDFAGGLVVHVTAGVGALVAACVVGPRRNATMVPGKIGRASCRERV